MESAAKKIWQYSDNNRKHHITIFVSEHNILIVVNEGIAFFDGCSKAFDFIQTYVKKTQQPACLLLDNAGLRNIAENTKILFLRFLEAEHIFKRIATIGNNPMLRRFGKTYQTTCRFTYKVRSFMNRQVALLWLRGRD